MPRALRFPRVRSGLAIALGIVGIAACQAVTPAATPEGFAVQVSDHPAPPEARPLGPVEAKSGKGCGLSGEQGSREKAVALLRQEVASEGGDYVRITSVVTPHLEMACYDNRFIVRGLAFRVAQGPMPAIRVEPRCSPACAEGYACDDGACVAVCDPPCGLHEVCAQDRVCRPAPPATPSPSAAPPSTTPPPATPSNAAPPSAVPSDAAPPPATPR